MRSRYLSTGDKLAVNFFLCLDCFDFLNIFSSLYTSNAATIEQRLSALLHRSFVQFFFQSSQALVAVTQVGNKRLPLRFLLLFLIHPSDPGQVASSLLVIFTPSTIDESLHIRSSVDFCHNYFLRPISPPSDKDRCTSADCFPWSLSARFRPVLVSCAFGVSINLLFEAL